MNHRTQPPKKTLPASTSKSRHTPARSWLHSLLLAFSSAVLLLLSFPNANAFYLAFIALVPLFIVLDRKPLLQAFIALEVFVILFYTHFLWWVRIFHPIALPGIVVYLCILYAIPFFAYRLLRGRRHNIYDHFLLAALFTLLEYLRGLGFPRFPYGNIAYTQHSFLAFIQLSEITGFLGISFLLYLSNSFIAQSLGRLLTQMHKTFKSFDSAARFVIFNRSWIIVLILVLNISYGNWRMQSRAAFTIPPLEFAEAQNLQKAAQQQTENEKAAAVPTKRPIPFTATLIQPWFDYNITDERLKILSSKLFRLTTNSIQGLPSPSLSTAAPQLNPPPRASSTVPASPPKVPDLIIWPESGIDSYYQYELENFILSKDRQTLQANADERPYSKAVYEFISNLGLAYQTTLLTGGFKLELITKKVSTRSPTSQTKAQSPKPEPLRTIVTGYNKYNAALLINDKGLVTDWSGKKYLVPFAEYFPFKGLLTTFPFIQTMLSNARATQFKPYSAHKLFFHNNVPFSVLICYEDTVAELSRTFSLAGARFLVIITNDAWSYSSRSQAIHYIFSPFRAIENRRPVLRVGNAGVTGLIDPLGRIHAALPMFVEGYVNVAFMPQAELTFYTSFGDWFVILLAGLVILLVAPFRFLRFFINKLRRLIAQVQRRSA